MFESVLHQSLGGGVTPFSGLYAKALPNRGAFFVLAVYEREEKFVILVFLKGCQITHTWQLHVRLAQITT